MEIENMGVQKYLPYHLTEEIKWGIVIAIKYYNDKYSTIEKIFNIQKGTISKIWKKY